MVSRRALGSAAFPSLYRSAEEGKVNKSKKNACFTRKMKKTHTILLPQMLEYHSCFLKAAFEGSGYRFDIMHGSKKLKDRALKYINHDYCYPGVLIVGQILEVLEEKSYPADRIAFMEPQAGGACRAGNYYQTIIHTLKKCGQEQIPVISLNFRGQEKHPGFRITPKLLSAAVAAVCFGDLMMCLYQQVKPYEDRSGEADRVRYELEQEIMEHLRMHQGIHGKKRREIYRHMIKAFAGIAVHKEEKKKIGITGEIYVKFSSIGNHGLEDFLLEHNCECMTGGFINYAIYIMDSEKSVYQLNHSNKIPLKAYDMILKYLKRVQKELYLEIGRSGRFRAELPFDSLKKKAEDIIGCSCITGDGWLVAAEVGAAVECGCKNVLILHPFGCLVSHVCERGILHKLRMRYPGVNIQTIEYDYDSSNVLRESRILLGLG